MFDRARRWGDVRMLRYWRDGAWRSMDWDNFGRQAASAARALRAAGVSAGDRVLIVSENRPEFPIAEVALMAIRAVPVPAYTTFTVADFAHVMADSGASAAIVSTASLASRVVVAAPLDLLVTMEAFDCHGARVLPWASLVADQSGFADIAAETAIIPVSYTHLTLPTIYSV